MVIISQLLGFNLHLNSWVHYIGQIITSNVGEGESNANYLA